jgi:hypothetical protein
MMLARSSACVGAAAARRRPVARVAPAALARRWLLTGCATTEGLAAYAARFGADALVPSSRMARTPGGGWRLPALVFGGDDLGAPVGDRMGLLHVAVLRRGVNAVLLDGDALFARRNPASELFTPRPLERDWEAHALRRLAGPGGKVAREELLVMLRLAVGPARFEPGTGVDVADVPARLAAALTALDLQSVDVLHVHVPASPATFPPDRMGALLRTLEECVASGHISYYGIGADAFTAVDAPPPPSTASAGTSSAASTTVDPLDPTAGQPLRALFGAAEGLRGHAASRRAELLRQATAAGVPFPLGNTLGRPDFAATTGTPGAEDSGDGAPPDADTVWRGGVKSHPSRQQQRTGSASSAPAPGTPLPPSAQHQQHPAPDGHHLVALTYPLSPTRPLAVLPTVVDGSGTPFSAAELAARYGVAQLVRAPLDVPVVVPASGTLFVGGGGSALGDGAPAAGAAATAGPAPLAPRTFRCVSPSAHPEWHPSLLMPQINDVLNYCVHLEVLWERAVKGEVDAARRAAAAAPPPGKTGGAPAHAVGAGDGPAFALPPPPPGPAGGLPMSHASPGVRAALARMFPSADATSSASQPPGSHPHPSLSNVTNATSGAPASGAGPDLAVALRPEDVGWARLLAQHWERVDNPADWTALKGRRIGPALARLAAATRGVDSVREWVGAYTQLMGQLVARIDVLMEQTAHHRSAAAAAALDAALPALAGALPASADGTGSIVPRLLTALLCTPIDAVATEVPEAFGARRKPADELRSRVAAKVRDAQAAAAAAAAPLSGAAAGTSSSSGSEASAEDAAQEARLAARAAEIDAFIAGIVRQARAGRGGTGVTAPSAVVAGSRTGAGGVRLVGSDATAVPVRTAAAAAEQPAGAIAPGPEAAAVPAGSDASTANGDDGSAEMAADAAAGTHRAKHVAVSPLLLRSASSAAAAPPIPFAAVQAAFGDARLRAAFTAAAASGLPDWELPPGVAAAGKDGVAAAAGELAPLQAAVRRASVAVGRLPPAAGGAAARR